MLEALGLNKTRRKKIPKTEKSMRKNKSIDKFRKKNRINTKKKRKKTDPYHHRDGCNEDE